MKIIASTLAAFMLLLACTPGELSPRGKISGEDKSGSVSETGISLNQETLTLFEGESVTLIATLTPNHATDKSVSWSTSNEDVATVDDNGKVTGINAGNAIITATVQESGNKATCTVTVEASSVPAGVVDLGLSVKWAAFNICEDGFVSAPEKCGDFYAWGETEPHYKDGYAQSWGGGDPIWKDGTKGYMWATYKWCDGSSAAYGIYTTLTKYNTNTTYGEVDNKTELEPQDDVAYLKLGDRWRMPTGEEWNELKTKCTWTWTAQNGSHGYKVTSKNNSNSIFLPAAGYRYDTSYYIDEPIGMYWSSSLGTGGSCSSARSIELKSNRVSMIGNSRCFGLSVRPVYCDIMATSISVTPSTLSLEVGQSVQLTATVTPAKPITWTSSDINVATVDANGKVTTVSKGTVLIKAKAYDGSGGVCAECSIQVCRIDTPNAVNLGLPSGLKWASFNIGASNAEENGLYYAWGETEPKLDYSWSTYKFGTNSSGPYSKYNTTSSNESVILDHEDDVAQVKLGEKWHMPTYAEWKELTTACTWTKTTQNGVDGYKVTSNKNSNSIFLPATGYWDGTSLYQDSGAMPIGYYWVSSLSENNSASAYLYFFITGAGGMFNTYYRCKGLSVRPVYGDIVVTLVSITPSTLTLEAGQSASLTASVTPARSITWTSSDTNVATVDANGNVKAVSKGTAIIKATANDGSGSYAECSVQVLGILVTSISVTPSTLSLEVDQSASLTATVLPDNAYDKSINWTSTDNTIATVDASGKVTAVSRGQAVIKAMANDDSGVLASCAVSVRNPCPAGAVDLGLSVYWAPYNISENGFVSSPEEYGDYYAWGETSTKLRFSNTSYKWIGYYNGSYGRLTKYNTMSSLGKVDNKIKLDPEDDVAHVKLGGNWRIPRAFEYNELKTECIWTWTTQNDVKGYKVTSKKNGNSIFLPAAGIHGNSTLDEAGAHGYYWSSALYTDNPLCAYCTDFDSGEVPSNSYCHRTNGCSIRPVSE